MTNLDVLHTDYEDRCKGKCFTAHSAEAFAEEFDGVRGILEFAGNITKTRQPLLRDRTRGCERCLAANAPRWSQVTLGVALRHPSCHYAKDLLH